MKILDIRNYFNLSKDGFAKFLGVSSKEVSDWEQDQSKLTEKDMAKFYKVFNIKKEDLLSSKNSTLLKAKIKWTSSFDVRQFRDEYYKEYSIYNVKKRKKIPLILWPFIVLFWFIIVIIVFAAAFADFSTSSISKDTIYLLENAGNIIIIEAKGKYVYVTPIDKKVQDEKFEYSGYIYKKIKRIDL